MKMSVQPLPLHAMLMQTAATFLALLNAHVRKDTLEMVLQLAPVSTVVVALAVVLLVCHVSTDIIDLRCFVFTFFNVY